MIEHDVTDDTLNFLAEQLFESCKQYFEMYQLKHPGENCSIIHVQNFETGQFVVISNGTKIQEIKAAIQNMLLGN